MKADSVKCEGCGADLPATLGLVTCQYCGKQTHVRPATRAQRQFVVQAAPDVQPRTKKMVGVIVAVSLLGMIPAIVIPILATQAVETTVDVALGGQTAGSSAADQAAQSAGEQIRRQVEKALGGAGITVPHAGALQLNSRICLLDDINGDGAAEVSAFLSADRNKVPAIVDGANGTVLWSGQSLGTDTHINLLCAGTKWLVAVNNQSFELVMINAHDTTQQMRRALSDELDYYGVSDECIAFKTSDRQTLGLSVEDGAERRCNIRAHRRPHIEDTTTCGIISTLRRGASFEFDDLTYRMTARRPGTPFLQVRAKRGRRELWDVPLRLVPVRGEAIGCFVGAAAPGVFMAFGAPRGNDHAVTILGLNAESGTERWSTDLAGTYGSINEIYYNGRYVVAGARDRIVAIDSASGAIAWQVGG